ncbi:Uu.00g048690.m01.CDS01 [Anthostomella pinea]|uniref:Uu.00g048690.m01.CDS01 n=1 Tax=Anthostomella pinea TaxID=933095 RepID=A0AAI8VCR7_9PEZI|nr:Uu.00g048690.m01.CDS01 [Anthostomella pinea]
MSRAGKLAPEQLPVLFVKNLNYEVTDEALWKLFDPEPQNRIVRVSQIRKGISLEAKGTAYVVFWNAMDAKNALEKLNGFNFQNRYLVVLWHQPEKTLKARESKDDIKARQENVEQLKTKYAHLILNLVNPSGTTIALSHLAVGVIITTCIALRLLCFSVSVSQDTYIIGMPFSSTLDVAFNSLLDVPTSVATATSTAAIGVDLPAATTHLTSVLTSTASAVAAAATSAEMDTFLDDDGGGGGGECRLLGPFALFVQLALGGLALSTLVFKRWRERPQRPLKIWFFDVSKQVFGSVLVHMANVFMSMLTSGRFSIKLDPASVQTARALMRRADDGYTPNPCSFYLLNLAIDTTIGIPILILLLRVTTVLVSYTPLGKPAESIQSGNYGNPPKWWWWLKQSVIYFCGLFGMKICVLIIFLILPWISRVGDWALRWTEGNERLQIVFVMMLFPLIMNGLQYYIIDSFIKMKDTDHERLPQEDHHERDPFDDALADSDDDDASSSGESSESVKLARSKSSKGAERKHPKIGHEEYDPELDGQTVIGSSKSQDERGGKPLPKELVPPE